MSNPNREHILITVLGLSPKRATYVLDGREATTELAPVALYTMLPEGDRPDRVLALCTPDAAEETLPALRDLLGPRCPVTVVEVSPDHNDAAVDKYLIRLAESVPDDADLTVDVTHGLRHMSFLTYVGVLYLTALRGLRLRGAYYGMLRNAPEKSAFFDLRPLVKLPSWFHGVRVLTDTGDPGVIADLVASSKREEAARVSDALRDLSEAYSTGLPIELGYDAGRFLDEHVQPLRSILHAERLPLADKLVDDLAETLGEQRLAQELPDDGWKAHARLDRAELERQARLIDGYLARQDFATAFGMMREWLVLWYMWRTNTAVEHWLKYGRRKPIEGRLRFLASRARDSLTPQQAMVGEVWENLREVRNAYAHHGLDKEVNLSREERLRKRVATIERIWREKLRTVPEFPIELPSEASTDEPSPARRVLVSPVGLRSGVLYSALRAADPQQVAQCLVICSPTTEAAVEEACRAAGYTGEVEFLRFDDPFAGIGELKALLQQAKQHLGQDSEVYVNITGGTTLMGVLADRIAGKARHLGQPAYQFALVDRRSPGEQETDPYQQGEVCWLDKEPRKG